MKRELVRHVVRTNVWDEASQRYVPLDVSLVLDLDKIAFDMGRKCRTSKSGRSIGMRGGIVAHVTKGSGQ